MECASAVAVEPNKLFDRVIPRLRRVALDTSDFGLSLRALAVVASVTGEDGDIRVALEKAHEAVIRSSKAEALAVLVKILAEARHFLWARKIATEMSGLDSYWYAEARIWIARFSAEESDIATAHKAVGAIHAHYVRVEAKHDMDILLSKKHHHTGRSCDSRYYGHLDALLSALTELREFKDDAHCVRPRHTSAHLHHKANGAISWFFADLMDQ